MSNQYYFLTEDPLGEGSPIRLAENIPEDNLAETKIYRISRRLLAILEEADSVKLTQKGNLPLNIVNLIYEEEKENSPESFSRFARLKLRSEDDYPDLKLSRFLLTKAGISKKRNNKLSFTKKGKEILGSPSRIYLSLLRSFISDYEWGSNTFYGSNWIGTYGLGFALIWIKKFGDEVREPDFYSDMYLARYARPDNDEHNNDIIRRLFSYQFMENFLEDFGLASLERKEDKWLTTLTGIRKTPLFDAVFEFDDFLLQEEDPGRPKPMTHVEIENFHQKMGKIIESRDFESIEELNAFMAENLTGKSIDQFLEAFGADLPDEDDQFDELMEALNEPNLKKRERKLKNILKENPENVEALCQMANLQSSLAKAAIWFRKAINAGRRTFGEDFFRENAGHFWSMPETRPFMRAMEGLAEVLVIMKKYREASEIYSEMLELNPGDNLGVRYELVPLLIARKKKVTARKLWEEYAEDFSFRWPLYRAILEFVKDGPSLKARRNLHKAYELNPFFPIFLLAPEEVPEDTPDYYQPGDETEARMGLNSFMPIIIAQNYPDLLDWLFKETLEFLEQKNS